jgi:hypothetical protein
MGGCYNKSRLDKSAPDLRECQQVQVMSETVTFLSRCFITVRVTCEYNPLFCIRVHLCVWHVLALCCMHVVAMLRCDVRCEEQSRQKMNGLTATFAVNKKSGSTTVMFAMTCNDLVH